MGLGFGDGLLEVRVARGGGMWKRGGCMGVGGLGGLVGGC